MACRASQVGFFRQRSKGTQEAQQTHIHDAETSGHLTRGRQLHHAAGAGDHPGRPVRQPDRLQVLGAGAEGARGLQQGRRVRRCAQQVSRPGTRALPGCAASARVRSAPLHTPLRIPRSFFRNVDTSVEPPRNLAVGDGKSPIRTLKVRALRLAPSQRSGGREEHPQCRLGVRSTPLQTTQARSVIVDMECGVINEMLKARAWPLCARPSGAGHSSELTACPTWLRRRVRWETCWTRSSSSRT